MRLPSATVLAASLCLAAPLHAQARSAAETAVRHAVSAWAGVRTVRASFEQTVTNTLVGSTANATGSYQQERPDRLAVTFQDPDGDRIVADGQWLWVYLPSSMPGRVTRQAEPANGSGTVDVTAQFLDRPLERYEIADAGPDTVSGRPARAVVLTPKADGPREFSRAKVWIDDSDGYIRKFEVSQSNGVIRRVHLTSLAVNVPVNESAFHFVVPKGVRVVER